MIRRLRTLRTIHDATVRHRTTDRDLGQRQREAKTWDTNNFSPSRITIRDEFDNVSVESAVCGATLSLSRLILLPGRLVRPSFLPSSLVMMEVITDNSAKGKTKKSTHPLYSPFLPFDLFLQSSLALHCPTVLFFQVLLSWTDFGLRMWGSAKFSVRCTYSSLARPSKQKNSHKFTDLHCFDSKLSWSWSKAC